MTRTRPNFLVIGVPKSGTTSLYHYLKQHPDIYMSPVKEPSFFQDGERGDRPAHPALPMWKGWPRGKAFTTWDKYLELFQDARGEKAVGEASTSNFYPRARGRIQRRLPRGRFICILRHPVDRAYSNFLHGKRDDREPERDFLAAYRASGGGARDNWPRALRYQRFGAYAAGLKDWRARFHPDQLSIHLYEDLVDDPRALMKTLYRFLQVDDAFIPDISVRHNRGHLRRNMALFNLIRSRHPVKTLLRSLLPRTVRRGLSKGVNACNRKEAPRLDPGIRRALTRELRDEILDLQDLIQRDLSHWLETG